MTSRPSWREAYNEATETGVKMAPSPEHAAKWVIEREIAHGRIAQFDGLVPDHPADIDEILIKIDPRLGKLYANIKHKMAPDYTWEDFQDIHTIAHVSAQLAGVMMVFAQGASTWSGRMFNAVYSKEHQGDEKGSTSV